MAFDCFLKIQNLPGECTDDKHKDWIEILSYNHGVSQPTSGTQSSAGSRTAERVNHQSFSVVKQLDKTSPKLNLKCCNGEHIQEIKVELCRAGGEKQKYMEYIMNDVIVSSVRPGGSNQGGGDVPLEEVAFSYGKITWTYTELDHKTGQPGGNVSANWSTIENKGN